MLLQSVAHNLVIFDAGNLSRKMIDGSGNNTAQVDRSANATQIHLSHRRAVAVQILRRALTSPLVSFFGFFDVRLEVLDRGVRP